MISVSRAAWRRLFWLCVLAGLVLSLWPEPEHKQAWFPHADKVQHALAFSVLVGLGRLAQFESKRKLFAGLLLLGIGIEALQSFTATRTAEWADVWADVVGLLLGFAAAKAIGRRSGREPEVDRR